MTSVLEAALGGHVAGDDEEAADLARVRTLVEFEGAPWSRAARLHLTASALVVDPSSGQVLLRWHAKQKRWLQVGGHGDEGESDPWAVALREAREETGLLDLRPWPDQVPSLFQVAVVAVSPVGEEPAHEHADLRYLLATRRPDEVAPEVEGVPLRWCSVEEALTLADPGLARLLLRYSLLVKPHPGG